VGSKFLIVIAAAAVAAGTFGERAHAEPTTCANPETALPVSRVVEIDASNGPMFGTVTRQVHEPSFLQPKEVVLTFDDGPMPWITKSILATLDKFCTKATFFPVGQMALAYPSTVRDELARGHTVGSHTYSHPFNMPRMKSDAATGEIERGIAAVSTAAGAPVAPFFRFTGLADSSKLLAYLQTRAIATFTVDVVSNDSYIHDVAKLTERTMAEVRHQHGGIILFHDIKTTTAKALPGILTALKAEGYSVVHLVAKRPSEPLEAEMRAVAPKLATVRNGVEGGKTLLPFYGAVGPAKTADTGTLEVTSVAPEARQRTTASEQPAQQPVKTASRKATVAKHTVAAAKPVPDGSGWMKSSIVDMSGPPVHVETSASAAKPGGWVTNIKPGTAARSAKPAQ
jgi:peptidoglycan/xylan/chitin deacetylase (PgdA/CDA1 family)